VELPLLRDIVMEIMNKDQLLFLHAKNLCCVLHQLILFCSRNDLSGAESLSESFLKLFQSLQLSYEHKAGQCKPSLQIPGFCDLLVPLMDMTLDSPQAGSIDFSQALITKAEAQEISPFTNSSAKTPAYERVTLGMAVRVLTAYPMFALWRLNCFKRYFTKIISYQTKEPHLLVKPLHKLSCHVVTWLTFIWKKGYYRILSSVDKPSDEVVWYKSAASLIQELLQNPSTSARFVGLDFLQVIGCLSQVKVSESLYNWRPEFQALLKQFCEDKEAFIHSVARRVEISEPVRFTESSFSLEQINASGIFVAWQN